MHKISYGPRAQTKKSAGAHKLPRGHPTACNIIEIETLFIFLGGGGRHTVMLIRQCPGYGAALEAPVEICLKNLLSPSHGPQLPRLNRCL